MNPAKLWLNEVRKMFDAARDEANAGHPTHAAIVLTVWACITLLAVAALVVEVAGWL